MKQYKVKLAASVLSNFQQPLQTPASVFFMCRTAVCVCVCVFQADQLTALGMLQWNGVQVSPPLPAGPRKYQPTVLDQQCLECVSLNATALRGSVIICRVCRLFSVAPQSTSPQQKQRRQMSVLCTQTVPLRLLIGDWLLFMLSNSSA